MPKRIPSTVVTLAALIALSCIPVTVKVDKAVETIRRERDSLSVDAGKDSLLGDRTKDQLSGLVDEAGGSLARWLAAYRDTIIGEQTQELLGRAFQRAVLDTLPSLVVQLRHQLLGEPARLLIDTPLHRAAGGFARSYEDSVRPVLREEQKQVERGAGRVLRTVAAVGTGLILLGGLVFGFVRAYRFRRLLNIVAMQIHGIPDRQQYDNLVKRISASATSTGDEVRLRAILKDQGILGEAAWQGE